MTGEKKGCEQYLEGHTEWYKDRHFYLFKFNRGKWGETKHTIDSYTMGNSNIAELISGSIREGTFISLEKISMIEYGNHFGGSKPCCMTQSCDQGNGWPKCVKID